MNQCKECSGASVTRYMRSPAGREVARLAQARYRERHPERRQPWDAVKGKARNDLNYAVDTGKVRRSDCCESCRQAVYVEAHHHRGYSPAHALDVLWLCKACHGFAHRRSGKAF
jgi:hypothetical protein